MSEEQHKKLQKQTQRPFGMPSTRQPKPPKIDQDPFTFDDLQMDDDPLGAS